MAQTAAVFFDVDFTLIRPGPRFLGSGYADTCRRQGVDVDQYAFDRAVQAAAGVLDSVDQRYSDELFVSYTACIIEGMGGRGPGVTIAARQIYDEWAEHQYFEMYDDVPAALGTLHARGLKLGLISNSHRCLTSFQSHFSLEGLLSVAVSSAEFGVMKPDPRIFRQALDLMQVPAEHAVMVGDSLAHDVMGATAVGMRAVLLDRDARLDPRTGARDPAVTVIRSLGELAEIL